MHIIKSIVILISLLCFSSLSLYAHNPAIPLEQNHYDASLNWHASGGIDSESGLVFKNGLVQEVVFNPITSEYNGAFAGSYVTFDYGLLSWFAMGIKLNLFEPFVFGIRDNQWKLRGSLMTRFNIFSIDPFFIHVTSEIQPSPIFSIPKSNWIDDGLINWFNTLSFNWRCMKTENSSLFLYLDLKHIASFVNTLYNADNLSLDNFQIPQQWIDRGVTVKYGALNRFVLTPGLEWNWGSFILYAGFNVPVIDVGSVYYTFHWQELSSLLYMLYFNNIELEWRWRF